MKLNPLDGVYYCDIRPNVVTEAFSKTTSEPLTTLFLRAPGDY